VEGEEDSTAAVAEDFMEAGEQRFTGVEVSPEEPALGSPAEARLAGFVAATLEVAVASAGADGIGAEETVMAGAGDLALGGRIGVGDGDIRMPTTTPGITRLTLIIRTRIMVLRTTILRAIPIRAMGTMILPRQVPTRGPCPTRTDRQDPGDHRCREAHPTRATPTATLRASRRMGQFCLLTG
jgi:hypothetical protein